MDLSWNDAQFYPPDRLTLHLTNLCNANCTFCGYQFQEDRHSFLSDKHFFEAVSQYREMGGELVDFTPLVGDALIDPKVFERISYVTGQKIFKKVFLYTNGILLGRKNYPEKLLESAPTQVTFSVPGFDKSLYKRVYRNSSYKRMLTGVNRFLKFNCDAGKPVKVYFALKPDVSEKEGVYTEDFSEYIEPYIDSDSLRYVRLLDSWGGSVTKEVLTGNMELADPIPVDQKRIPCYYTYFVSILVDGSVRLCGCRFNNGSQYDALVVGHLDKESLTEIWSSEETRRVRSSFVQGNLASVCVSCSHYGPYTGKERAQIPIL